MKANVKHIRILFKRHKLNQLCNCGSVTNGIVHILLATSELPETIKKEIYKDLTNK